MENRTIRIEKAIHEGMSATMKRDLLIEYLTDAMGVFMGMEKRDELCRIHDRKVIYRLFKELTDEVDEDDRTDIEREQDRMSDLSARNEDAWKGE